MQNSYQQLAKEFMNIWQKQIASVMNDKEFISAMLEMINSTKMPNTKSDAKHTKTTSSANSSFAGDAGNAQLAYRLAMCERRIAALEKGFEQKIEQKKTRRKSIRRSKT